MDTITKEKGHENYGMFVLVLIAHGSDGFLVGPYGRIKLADIYAILSEFMPGKPKWVIVESCSGDGKACLLHFFVSMHHNTLPAMMYFHGRNPADNHIVTAHTNHVD